MALSNMQVFNDNVRNLAMEKIAQKIELFNQASNGTILLSSNGFTGDFFQRSFYDSLQASGREVDRYATNSAVSALALSQSKASDVKVAGGFGPVLIEPSQMSWIGSSEVEATMAFSQAMSEYIIFDQLNTAILSLVAAIGNQSTATNDISATAGSNRHK